MCAKLLQSYLTLCDTMDCSLPGPSVHGILQARILEWVPCPSPGDLPNLGIEPRSRRLPADSLLSEPPFLMLIALLNSSLLKCLSLIYRYFQIKVEKQCTYHLKS